MSPEAQKLCPFKAGVLAGNMFKPVKVADTLRACDRGACEMWVAGGCAFKVAAQRLSD
jgi:hypothetical protein